MTDNRFSAVKSLIETEKIKQFQDIFEIVPKTVLGKAIHMNGRTLSRKAEKTGLFTIDEIDALAREFDVDFLAMVKLIKRPNAG